MNTQILTKEQWKDFVRKLIASTTVIGVQQHQKKFYSFQPLTDADNLCLDYDVTYLSPRKFFQPPRETLLRFTTGAKVEVQPVVEAKPFVLLGVHPYDVKAINQMDAVFQKDNPDTNYLARRRAATTIACDPMKASTWSFWASMNASTVDTGYDLYVTDIGSAYLVEVGTDKGEALLKRHTTARDATQDEIKRRTDLRANIAKLCAADRRLKPSHKDLAKLVASGMNHPIWEDNAKKCYSCGTCNTVCPTCYCFDVREEIDLDMKHGRRTRHWDGCLLQDFAVIGSGENFREHRPDRYRHRILRKSSYVPAMIGGDPACVGCGRCSSQCVPDIADPVKIFNTLAEEK